MFLLYPEIKCLFSILEMENRLSRLETCIKLIDYISVLFLSHDADFSVFKTVNHNITTTILFTTVCIE